MKPRVWADGAVRAAGGVVARRGADGLEVVVIHRPHRDDWSLPKGHLEVGETAPEAAVREVEEETGLTCRLVRPLSPARYIDSLGQPKVVDYWLMEVIDGEFRPNSEVDLLEWMSPERAHDRLSYPADRQLVLQVVDTSEP